MAITNKDIEKLKEHFATKKDLEQFATKNDLKRFATKEDLKRFATKEDLQSATTRLEGTMREYRDEVVTGLDKVMGELQISRDERLMMKARVDRIEQRFEEHILLPAHSIA